VIPAENLEARRDAFWYLIVYVGSALALLLTTSFLGLRRYLRQRKLQMPQAMTGLWVGSGAVLIVLVLAVCAVIPRPSPEYAAGSFTGRLSSEELEASEYAVLSDSGTEDPSGQAAPGEGEGESTGQSSGEGKGRGEQGGSAGSQQGESQQGGGQSGDSGQGSQGQQGQGSQGEGSQGQGSSSQGSQAGGEQSSDASSSESSQESGDQGEASGDSQSSEDSSQESTSSATSPSWMPDLSGGLFMLGRWILNLLLILAVMFIVIRYWRQIVTGFQQLWQSWQRLLALLFGRKTPEPDEAAAADEAGQPLPSFADFPNPFARPIRGVQTPEQLVAYSFRALEAWAAEHELARHAQETPWEFADRIGALHAPLARPTRELAMLYARLNYAGQPLTAACLPSVRAFWESVESVRAPVVGASVAAK
jgi:hypothetical protein